MQSCGGKIEVNSNRFLFLLSPHEETGDVWNRKIQFSFHHIPPRPAWAAWAWLMFISSYLKLNEKVFLIKKVSNFHFHLRWFSLLWFFPTYRCSVSKATNLKKINNFLKQKLIYKKRTICKGLYLNICKNCQMDAPEVCFHSCASYFFYGC